MNTPAERREKITKLRDLPKQLQAAVKGLNKDQLLTPYREGGWTVAQVVHHLADSHMNAYVRMRLIATQENPTLNAYDQNVWAALKDSTQPSITASLAVLKGLHKRWVVFLKSRKKNDWKRVGLHPERGEVSLDDLLNIYSRHGENHVAQITGLRKARGW
ncbi:MAG: YfiT family bacillithiol transferase [Acidobacteriota bacterium]